MIAKKSHVALILSAILFTASIGVIVLATNPNTPTYGQPGSMISTANFIFGQDSTGLYFARNGTTGGISYASTNASYVFQSAIDSRRSVGGSFYFNGNITLTWGITLYPSMTLFGDGVETAFLGTAGLIAASNLKVSNTFQGPVITLKVDPLRTNNLVFPNLYGFTITEVGSNPPINQDGIRILNSPTALKDVYITEVGIFSVGGSGINVTAAGTQIWLDKSYIESTGQWGAVLTGSSMRVTNTYFYNAKYAQLGIKSGGAAYVFSSWFYSGQASGIKAGGSLTVANSNFVSNALWAIDGTSTQQLSVTSSFFSQNGQSASANSGGAIILWSTTLPINIVSNFFSQNGGSSNAAIFIQDLPTIAVFTINGNTFYDSRGASAGQYFIYFYESFSGTITGTVVGNAFNGQKTGNPAIKINGIARPANLIIRDNTGFNDILGKITNPIATSTPYTIGLAGSTGTVTASRNYTVFAVDQYVTVTGGTTVYINVTDPNGNLVQSGLSTWTGELWIGWVINFGGFTTAPTVTSYGL